MKVSAQRSYQEEIRHYREDYCREMACQIVHDSLHNRADWVEWYSLSLANATVGYGAVVVGGPWQGTRTAFEFYVGPDYRTALLDLFDEFISKARVTEVLTQTNDNLLCVGLHQRCRGIEARMLLFRDGRGTSMQLAGALVRKLAEREPVFEHSVEPVGSLAVEFDRQVVATGGYLCHYNPPFADLFMEVRPDMRRRGFGAFLIQEIKKAAYQAGKVPCARCDLANVASRRTLNRAGMIPCGHIVQGRIRG